MYELDEEIWWSCTESDNSGMIAGWKGTKWDNINYYSI